MDIDSIPLDSNDSSIQSIAVADDALPSPFDRVYRASNSQEHSEEALEKSGQVVRNIQNIELNLWRIVKNAFG